MQSLATSASASDQLVYNTATRIGQEAGLTKDQTWGLAGKLAGGVSGSGGFDLFGNSLKAFGELSGSVGYSEDQRESLRNFFSSDEGKQLARAFQENFSKNLAEDISSGRGTTVTNALGVTDSTSLSQTAAEKLSATEQYSQAASRQSSAESFQTLSVMQFANAIGKESMDGTRASLNEAVTRYGLGARAASLGGTYQRLLGMEQTSAHRAGQIMALEEFAKSGNRDAFAAADDYLDIMHGVTGRAPMMDNADAQAGLRDTATGTWNAGAAAAQSARADATGPPARIGGRIDRRELELSTSIDDARNRGIGRAVEAAVSDQEPGRLDPSQIDARINTDRGRLDDDPRVVMPLPGKLMDAAQASVQQVGDQLEAAAQWTGEMIPHDHPPATSHRERPEPDFADEPPDVLGRESSDPSSP
jgi:hypothetical protein